MNCLVRLYRMGEARVEVVVWGLGVGLEDWEPEGGLASAWEWEKWHI